MVSFSVLFFMKYDYRHSMEIHTIFFIFLLTNSALLGSSIQGLIAQKACLPSHVTDRVLKQFNDCKQNKYVTEHVPARSSSNTWFSAPINIYVDSSNLVSSDDEKSTKQNNKKDNKDKKEAAGQSHWYACAAGTAIVGVIGMFTWDMWKQKQTTLVGFDVVDNALLYWNVKKGWISTNTLLFLRKKNQDSSQRFTEKGWLDSFSSVQHFEVKGAYVEPDQNRSLVWGITSRHWGSYFYEPYEVQIYVTDTLMREKSYSLPCVPKKIVIFDNSLLALSVEGVIYGKDLSDKNASFVRFSLQKNASYFEEGIKDLYVLNHESLQKQVLYVLQSNGDLLRMTADNTVNAIYKATRIAPSFLIEGWNQESVGMGCFDSYNNRFDQYPIHDTDWKEESNIAFNKATQLNTYLEKVASWYRYVMYRKMRATGITLSLLACWFSFQCLRLRCM